MLVTLWTTRRCFYAGVAEDLTQYTPTIDSTKCINSANTVLDPLGNKTAYQFTNYGSCLGHSVVESQRQIYQGSSTLLRTVQRQWGGNFPISQTTILPSGLQTQVQ